MFNVCNSASYPLNGEAFVNSGISKYLVQGLEKFALNRNMTILTAKTIISLNKLSLKNASLSFLKNDFASILTRVISDEDIDDEKCTILLEALTTSILVPDTISSTFEESKTIGIVIEKM